MNEMKDLKVFIYPTDTVWGIGTLASLDAGSDYIADIKKTGKGKPLSVLFSSIELIKEYFQIPTPISDSWLSDFFKNESTLGLPVSWSKGMISKSVYAGMPHVCVRCIEAKEIKELMDQAGGPVLTTSVNETGHPPAKTHEEALKFKQDFVPEATFIELEELCPSGHSSTMVLLNENLSWTMIREGEKVEQVKKSLAVLSA